MESFLNALASGWLLTVAYIIAGAWAIVHVLRQRKEPMAMLLWIAFFILLPLAGPALYYLLGDPKVERRARKRRRRSAYILRAIASRSRDSAAGEGAERASASALELLDPALKALARILSKLGDSPLTPGNKVEVMSSPQQVCDELLAAFDAARHHIHLEYYIFRPDEAGRLIRDRLIERARAGIEVRVLLDGIGCWGTGRRFYGPLLEAGGKVKIFLPAVPLRSRWHINCRNHRKIVVVDGEHAFTGSQNIGNEYSGHRRQTIPWRDTHLKMQGPAAQELQEVFAEDWYFASQEDLAATPYLKPVAARGDSIVQIVSSGPDQDKETLTHILFAAISLARRSIRISTPYFVPERGMSLALQNAAYRGVSVEILIPAKTDLRLVLWAGRSYYQELVHAGVKIYEFDHAMLHSKTVTIDDTWCLVGSANMDIRSFFLNFEVTATVFDVRIVGQLSREFDAYAARSRPVELRKAGDPFWPSLLEGAARLLSPVL